RRIRRPLPARRAARRAAGARDARPAVAGRAHDAPADGSVRRFGTGAPRAAIRLENWRVFEAALARGDVGFAETWIDGSWHTDDLATLLSLLVANRDALERAVYGGWLGRIVGHLRHMLNRNSRAG